MLAVFWFAPIAGYSVGAEPPGDMESGRSAQEAESLRAFSQPIPGVDWEEIAPPFIRAMERIFEHNGWTEEPDQFALQVARKVAIVPPWDIAGRMKAFTEPVAERYGLSPEEADRFRASLLRVTAGLLLRHGPAMFAQGREALQARANGIPYTAEQVARWSKDADPVFRDLKQGVDRLSVEMEAAIDEDKKELYRKDVARYHERQQVVDRMTQRWAAGEWDAAQWGMEDDPIQMGRGKSRGENEAAGPAAQAAAPKLAPPLPEPVREVVIPSRWMEHDPSTWIAFVLEVRDRYRLDAGQMNTAWSIHGEMVERAAAYAQKRGEELSKVPVARRAEDEAYRPIRELFGELRERLEALPTSAQRDAVRSVHPSPGR